MNASRFPKASLFRLRRKGVYASVVLAMSAALIGAAAAQSQATAPQNCGTVTSLHWTVKTSKGSISGNRYTVQQYGFSCARALSLVPGLIKQKGGEGTVLNGPAGYHCVNTGVRTATAIFGACFRPGSGFGWRPKVG